MEVRLQHQPLGVDPRQLRLRARLERVLGGLDRGGRGLALQHGHPVLHRLHPGVPVAQAREGVDAAAAGEEGRDPVRHGAVLLDVVRLGLQVLHQPAGPDHLRPGQGEDQRRGRDDGGGLGGLATVREEVGEVADRVLLEGEDAVELVAHGRVTLDDPREDLVGRLVLALLEEELPLQQHRLAGQGRVGRDLHQRLGGAEGGLELAGPTVRGGDLVERLVEGGRIDRNLIVGGDGAGEVAALGPHPRQPQRAEVVDLALAGVGGRERDAGREPLGRAGQVVPLHPEHGLEVGGLLREGSAHRGEGRVGLPEAVVGRQVLAGPDRPGGQVAELGRGAGPDGSVRPRPGAGRPPPGDPGGRRSRARPPAPRPGGPARRPGGRQPGTGGPRRRRRRGAARPPGRRSRWRPGAPRGTTRHRAPRPAAAPRAASRRAGTGSRRSRTSARRDRPDPPRAGGRTRRRRRADPERGHALLRVGKRIGPGPAPGTSAATASATAAARAP